MYTTIFIDIDNTLLDFDICASNSMRENFKEFNLEYKPEYFKTFTTINNGLWRDIECGKLTREGLRLVRWNKVLSALKIEGVDGVAFEDSFHDKLKVQADPVDGAEELCKYLSKKYVLCAASNGPYEQQRYRLEKSNMLQYFTHLFISERAGASKPTKEFFDYCMVNLGDVKRDEIMLIGDSLTADILGGVIYNIDTIWFNHDKIAEPENKTYKYKVDTLYEIKNIL